MTRKQPELFTVIRDFTTLFYVILKRKSSEWIERSIESDLRIRFAIRSIDLAIRDFSFSKHFPSVRTVYGKECHYLIFVIRENEFLYP